MQALLGQIDPTSFWLGVIVAGLVGFVVFRVAIWWGGKVTQMWKPQTVVHKTAKSPLQVVLEGLLAVALGVIAVYLLWLAYQAGILADLLR